MEKLPDDVFFIIFEYLTSQYSEHIGSKLYNLYLLDVLLVCRRWYQLLMNNPRIWSGICITSDNSSYNPRSLGLARIQRYVLRSKEVPLGLFVDLGAAEEYPLPPQPREDIPRVIQLIHPHQWRMTSLEIRADHEVDMKDALLALKPDFPVLKWLRLEMIELCGDPVVEVPKLPFPCLEELRLYNIPIVWSTLHVKSLRKLLVESLSDVININTFISFLSTLPHLEVLDLCGIDISYSDNLPDIVKLPDLKVLNIRKWLRSRLLPKLLSHIAMPNLRALYVSHELRPSRLLETLGPLPHLEHLSLIWIKQTRSLLPQLALQMPNLKSLMLTASFSLPPLSLRFLQRPQSNGRFPFPFLTSLILRRVELQEVIDLVLARSDIEEVYLYKDDHYETPGNGNNLSNRFSQLFSMVKVEIFENRPDMDNYWRDIKAREFLRDGDLIWPKFIDIKIICIEDYLEEKFGFLFEETNLLDTS